VTRCRRPLGTAPRRTIEEPRSAFQSVRSSRKNPSFSFRRCGLLPVQRRESVHRTAPGMWRNRPPIVHVGVSTLALIGQALSVDSHAVRPSAFVLALELDHGVHSDAVRFRSQSYRFETARFDQLQNVLTAHTPVVRELTRGEECARVRN
jgi:hypothetical protein